MKVYVLGVIAALLSASAWGDVFKYVDANGNIYFSDEALSGGRYKLEWKRTARKLVLENKAKSSVLGGPSLTNRDALQYARLPKKISRSMSVRRKRYNDLIAKAAARHRLSPALLHAVIRTESAYKERAVSHAGACGLMQLMPATARRFKVNNIFDPTQNIAGGAAYLRFLLDFFDNDLRLALAGYNAGENAVLKYGRKIPPYKETQDYVRKVMQHFAAERVARRGT